MRQQVLKISCAFIAIVFTMASFAQKSAFSDLVKASSTLADIPQIRSQPMVIGPDLYNQMGELSGFITLNTQYLNPDFEGYSSYSADDFIVPAGQDWEIKYVRNTIHTTGSLDSIDYYNVYIYNDDNNKPGTIHSEDFENTNFKHEAIQMQNWFETTITLSNNVSLSEGKYWICIQPVTAATKSSSYGEPTSNYHVAIQNSTTAINSQAHFKNPGGKVVSIQDWQPQSKYWEALVSLDLGYYNHNFAIFGVEKNNDLAVADLKSPTTGPELSAGEHITTIIQNNGLNNISGSEYVVKYRINGGEWIGTADNGVDIASGTEVEIIFRDKADLSVQGIYSFDVEIIFADDENPNNNFSTFTVENYGKLFSATANSKKTYTTCSGTFTGHAGLENITESYSNDTVVFLPGTQGNKIRLHFDDTGMSGSYGFKFYNGSSTNAPLLAYVQTQEMHDLKIEGANPEGALTIVIPGIDVKNNPGFRFLGKISCVPLVNVDYKVEGISTSKKYSWEKESIELTAHLLNQGLETSSPLVTFFINGQQLNEMVSTTTMAFGEKGTSKVTWTPHAAGTYNITAKVPADEGSFLEEKESTIEHEIYELGKLIEGFEHEMFPPEGWSQKISGGSLRGGIGYNFLDNWEGYYNVNFITDTLITPKLNIQDNDTLEFLYSAGFFGQSTLKIMYASEPNGEWKFLHQVDYSLPFTTNYKVPLKRAAGEHYLALYCTNPYADSKIDFVRGPKLYLNEFDLKAVDLVGNITTVIDQKMSYEFTIRNMGTGTLSGTDYSVKLWKNKDGEKTELTSMPGVDIDIANYHTFTLKHTFTDLDNLLVYATIEYSADQELINNHSKSINLQILKSGSESIYVGDPTSKQNNVNSIGGGYGSYSENIYYKENLNCKGEIEGITINIHNPSIEALGLKVFIGETDETNLSTGYFSTSALDEVFSGICDLEIKNSYQPYYIHFDKPFLYSGEKNLVIAFHRYLIDDIRTSYLRLQSTEVAINVCRAKNFQEYEEYTDVSNTTELNNLLSELRNHVPNITFWVKTDEMDASLIGNVSNEANENLNDAIITIDGYANTAKTDVDGNYIFPVMPYGDYNVNAIMHGYYDQTILGTFTNANQTTINFVLEGLKPVEVSGTVIANDSLNPISGVDVHMTGYDMEFFATTDANGNFSITDVWGDKEYKITFTHHKYATQTISVNVPFANYTIEDVTLDELETPALNVIALSNETGNVDLTWQAPYSGVENMVDPTQGNEFGEIWWNEPNEEVQLGNLFKVNKPGTVTSIQLSTYYWSGAVSAELQLRFYNKDQVEIAKPVPFNLPDTTTAWMDIAVPNFTYTDDFYVMIYWNKIPYSTQAIRGSLLDENVSWLIDGNGKWMPLTDVAGEAKSGALSIRAQVLESGSKSSKALLSYDLWRTNTKDIDSPQRWNKINAEPISETGSTINYSDDTFNETISGHYLYAVKANYTKGTSSYTYSNSINKGLYYTTTVNVTANNNMDITGTTIVLKNNNGAYINTYIGEVAEGKIEFQQVLIGDYIIEASNGAAYQKYSSNISVSNDTIINIELIEEIFTPALLSVENDYDNKIATLNWGLGDEKTYQLDDGSAEQMVNINVDADAQLGNIFNVHESGQIISVDILALINDGAAKTGKVSLVFYNGNQIKIGTTPEFVLEATEDAQMINVSADLIPFEDVFYVMVNYSSLETSETNHLAIDTDENPGNGYYYDSELGFVSMAEMNMWGNFIIRANVLVNGKKSAITASTTLNPVSGKIIETPNSICSSNISPVKVTSANRAALSYNIFINDMVSPIAEGVTSQYFIFNENEHLTEDGQNTYAAAVQAVFTTGNSVLATINFEYDKTVDIFDRSESNMEVYPNPTNAEFTITNCESSIVEIYDITGIKVYKTTINSNLETVNISTLSNGTYLIKVVSPTGINYKKIIKAL